MIKQQKIKEFIEKFTKLFSSDNYRKIIVALGIAGVALIFLSSFLKSEPAKAPDISKIQSNEEYTAKLEQDIREMVSNIKGAGDTKVLITLENGMENVYATEEKKNKEATQDKLNGETSKTKESDDLERKYITIKDSDGSEKALSVTQIQPKVKGVVIVCKGGNNPQVQERVHEAVKTLLNISSKRVFVTN